MDNNLTSALLISAGTIISASATYFAAVVWKPSATPKIILRYVLIAAFAGFSAILGVATYVAVDTYLKYRPRIASSLSGLTLGMTQADVVFARGEPHALVKGGEQMPSGGRIPERYSMVMVYRNASSEESELVRFDQSKKLVAISAFCSGNSWISLHGIGCGDTAPPERLTTHEMSQDSTPDSLSRLFCYQGLQTCFEGSKAEITAIHIFDQQFFPNGLTYTK